MRFDIWKLLVAALAAINLWLVGSMRSVQSPVRAPAPDPAPAPMRVESFPPPLQMELLARVQRAGAAGNRDLFRFAPSRKQDRNVPPSLPTHTDSIPLPLHQEPIPEPPPLTFYGYARYPTLRRAFFFDGSDTYLAKEGESIAGRFRIVRIGGSSAVVEDLKHSATLTLPLPD
jgi:hypothetical protein